MRILNVSAFFSGHGGGIEVVAGQLSRALAENGHVSVWAAANVDLPAPSASVVAVPLPALDPVERFLGLPMPLLSVGAMRTLSREIKAADAVIVHDCLYFSSILAAVLARCHRKPWLLVQHIATIPYSNPILRSAISLATNCITRPMLRIAPQVVFISNAVRRDFSDVTFSRPPALVFNGVEHSIFHPIEQNAKHALRDAIDIKGFDRVVLFVGRFVEKKGLAIVKEMAGRHPHDLFLMAGSGPIAPQSWELVNVRVLGKCTQARLAELYQAADVLLLPSAGEGYPLVIQEAMACGLPILCGLESATADPDAFPYLTGVEVDLSDQEGTADRFDVALARFKPGPDARAAAYARDRYDWAVGARRIEELFAGLA